jgi:hypothetical protein
MNIAKTIYNLITNDADLVALISTRCFPANAPQKGSKPYVVYDIYNTEPTDTKDGASKLDVVYFQISCYGKEVDTAIDINNKIRSAIDRFNGLNSSNVVDKIIFEGSDGPYFDEESELFRTDTDYRTRVRVDYGTTTPTWNVNYIVNVDGVQQATGALNVLEDQTININL